MSLQTLLFIIKNPQDSQLAEILQRCTVVHTVYFNPIALRTAKTLEFWKLWSFGCSECNRVKIPVLVQTHSHQLTLNLVKLVIIYLSTNSCIFVIVYFCFSEFVDLGPFHKEIRVRLRPLISYRVPKQR